MPDPRPPPDDAPARGGEERKAFLLRVPEALLADLKAWADQELRSLNGHLEWLLRDAVRRHKKEKPPA
ncbi:MAG: hypothetical protein JNM10_02245 [Planctomycetia bacterium]|nr:hypothetical protein [Planctomycetia bacterium]